MTWLPDDERARKQARRWSFWLMVEVAVKLIGLVVGLAVFVLIVAIWLSIT
jgi:hypothetical protein